MRIRNLRRYIWAGFRPARITVSGRSMEPNLFEGDRALFAYSPAGLPRNSLKRSMGKIVLIRRSAEPELLTIKRLVKELDTGYWVEGDNKESSTDSRNYLTISGEEIVGRMLFLYRRAH